MKLGSSEYTVARVIGNVVGPRLKKGCPNAYTRSPSTWVTVPDAPISKSPPARMTPTASPGASDASAGAACASDGRPLTGAKPEPRSALSSSAADGPEKPLITMGVAMGVSCSASWAPACRGRPSTSRSDGSAAKGRTCRAVAVRAAVSRSGVIGSSSRTRVAAARWAGSAVASIISPMGVMPAMGSLGNAPSE